MKKLNLVKLLAVLLVFNCSSDDNSNNTESQKTRIAKIEQKIFDFNNSSLLEERIVIDYCLFHYRQAADLEVLF